MLGMLGFVAIAVGLIVALVATIISDHEEDYEIFEYAPRGIIIACMGAVLAANFYSPVSKADYNYFVERKAYIENAEPETTQDAIAIGMEAADLNLWLRTNQEKVRGAENLYYGLPYGFINEEPINY